MFYRNLVLARLILTFVFIGLFACIYSPQALSADHLSEQTRFTNWLAEFKIEALATGISEDTLERALTGVKPLSRSLKSDRNQPEKKRTLDDYLTNAINNARIEKGRKLLRENWKLFAQTSDKYSVQSRFLVALWGIETNFGRNQGTISTIQTLVTLAYDKRRGAYFRKELLNALRIIDRGMIPLDRMKGSWAGALGQVQFMPSVYLKYAVDFNKDGKVDIQKTRSDALASAANYLSQLGWDKGWTWGREVKVPSGFDPELSGLDYRLRFSDWQRLGIRQIDGAALPKAAGRASLIRPDGSGGRSFLVYDNYRQLLKWNRSHKFAIAVGLLADQIGSQ